MWANDLISVNAYKITIRGRDVGDREVIAHHKHSCVYFGQNDILLTQLLTERRKEKLA
jgi:hypothetical protein